MKLRYLVLGLCILSLNAQGAVATAGSAAIVAANAAAMSAATTTVASTVTSNMMNSQNTVVVECRLEKELVKKEGEWVGTRVASLKETIEDGRCQYNKRSMEQLNNTHYEFGKVKGIFDVRGTDHVMIELIEVE